MVSRIGRTVILLVFALSIANAGLAQRTTATFAGIVQDSTERFCLVWKHRLLTKAHRRFCRA